MDIQQDWFEWCIKDGTSGDQVFDILEDWKKDREQLLQKINELEYTVKMLKRVKRQ